MLPPLWLPRLRCLVLSALAFAVTFASLPAAESSLLHLRQQGSATQLVKRDAQRFPRACDRQCVAQEILTPFSAANRDIDVLALVAMHKHLCEFDGNEHAVVLIQVENESRMISTARDPRPEANRAFASAVAAEPISRCSA